MRVFKKTAKYGAERTIETETSQVCPLEGAQHGALDMLNAKMTQNGSSDVSCWRLRELDRREV